MSVAFIHNCQNRGRRIVSPVSVSELNQAESYWLVESQQERFATEMDPLRRNQSISNSSPLVPFRPFLDSSGVLRAMMGQLPLERITPDAVFDKVGLDYAGPLLVKFGHVRRPTVVVYSPRSEI